MRKGLEIIIHSEGFSLCHAKTPIGMQYIGGREIDLGAKVAEFCLTNKVSPTKVTIYIDDELLFLKSFSLPLNTPGVKDAVKYQLPMVSPFSEEDMMYSIAIKGGKDQYNISLFSVQKHVVGKCIQELVNAGYTLAGLFPECQRYVPNRFGRQRWALVMPCQFTKIYLFSGYHLEDRFLSNTELDFNELADLCQTRKIYHLAPLEGSQFRNAEELLKENPALKEHNMLPEVYRRPDYIKYLIMILLGVNILAMAGLIGVKAYTLNARARQVDAEINSLLPKVTEVKNLKRQKKKIEKYIAEIKEIGTNPDLVVIFDKLTSFMPIDTYLDQLRYDEKTKLITIQGYTGNVADLTKELQDLGEARLKSTSRRKNQIYFQVEINMP